MAAKSPKKSPQQRRLRTPKHGKGKLMTGGTNKGGPGRPPDEFRAQMRALTSRPEVVEFLERCLKGQEGAQAALAAYKYATEQGHGKAEQRTTIAGDPDQPLEVVVRRE